MPILTLLACSSPAPIPEPEPVVEAPTWTRSAEEQEAIQAAYQALIDEARAADRERQAAAWAARDGGYELVDGPCPVDREHLYVDDAKKVERRLREQAQWLHDPEERGHLEASLAATFGQEMKALAEPRDSETDTLPRKLESYRHPQDLRLFLVVGSGHQPRRVDGVYEMGVLRGGGWVIDPETDELACGGGWFVEASGATDRELLVPAATTALSQMRRTAKR